MTLATSFYSFRKLSNIYSVELRIVGDAFKLLLEEGFIEKMASSGMYRYRSEQD